MHRGEAEEAWKIVSMVAPVDLEPAWLRTLIWMVGAFLGLLGAVAWQVARAKTRRQEAMAVAREMEEKLQAVTNTVQDGIAMVNAADEVVYWNPAAAAMFGYQSHEIMGQCLHPLVAGPGDQAKAAGARELFASSGGGPIVGRLREVEAIRKDGSSFPVELSVSSIQLAGVWYAVGTIRDITERRAAEQELVRYREYLEESVTERTIQLQQTNEELEAARDRAESANRAKSSFLANVSHEIRTPLNAIVGFTEILGRNLSDEGQKRHLESINRSGEALLHMIDDILDLSRLEAGSLDLRTAPVDTLKVLADTRTSFAPEAQRKGLAFRVDVDTGLPRSLVLDEKRFRQVLENLIDNAIKSTRDGEVSVSVTSAPGEEKTGTVDLGVDVADTGIGIPEDQLEEVYAPFTQQRDQSINEYGGTGLGLALTRGLLARMGGTIEVESRVGEGSVFHVSLRGVEVADATPIGALVAEGEVDSEPPLAGESSVWSASDTQEMARARLPELLRELEVQVSVCANLATTLTVNEVDDFAIAIQKLGGDFEVPPIVQWGERLAEQMSIFDMDAVAQSLSAFAQLVEEIAMEVEGLPPGEGR